MEEGIVYGIRGYTDDFTAQANESVNYVTAHDNLNLWDKIALSLGEKNLARSPYGLLQAGQDIIECDAVKASLLANGIVLSSQGIPFFQAGDEMLRSKFGDHNSYASPDRINKIRWENAALYREIVDYYAGLIRLRRAHPAFRQTTKAAIDQSLETLNAEDLGVSFVLKANANSDSWRTIFVAYNAGSDPKTFALPAAIPVWRQVVDAKWAGLETLAEVSGAVTLPPLSMAVLHE
jgi:pullulanase/glycogen debranching enzyme